MVPHDTLPDIHTFAWISNTHLSRWIGGCDSVWLPRLITIGITTRILTPLKYSLCGKLVSMRWRCSSSPMAGSSPVAGSHVAGSKGRFTHSTHRHYPPFNGSLCFLWVSGCPSAHLEVCAQSTDEWTRALWLITITMQISQRAITKKNGANQPINFYHFLLPILYDLCFGKCLRWCSRDLVQISDAETTKWKDFPQKRTMNDSNQPMESDYLATQISHYFLKSYFLPVKKTIFSCCSKYCEEKYTYYHYYVFKNVY